MLADRAIIDNVATVPAPETDELPLDAVELTISAKRQESSDREGIAQIPKIGACSERKSRSTFANPGARHIGWSPSG